MNITHKLLAGNGRSWHRALIYGFPAALLILVFFTIWFVLADRYIVFLYFHDMGSFVPDTSPFSRVTTSRYWMGGLVAAGAVMLLYLVYNWLKGRLSEGYKPPLWWQVWLVTSPILLLGIPAITMSFNEPVLPWAVAATVTVAAIAALGLALLPSDLAARNPIRLAWLTADGWGLALILLTLAHLEDFRAWLIMGSNWRLIMGLVLTVSGLLWLLLLSFSRARQRIPIDGAAALVLAGFCVAYLFLPIIHYTLGTDGYFYLTNSDNFFARGLGFQLPAWLVTALIAWIIVRLRLALVTPRKSDGE